MRFILLFWKLPTDIDTNTNTNGIIVLHGAARSWQHQFQFINSIFSSFSLNI